MVLDLDLDLDLSSSMSIWRCRFILLTLRHFKLPRPIKTISLSRSQLLLRDLYLDLHSDISIRSKSTRCKGSVVTSVPNTNRACYQRQRQSPSLLSLLPGCGINEPKRRWWSTSNLLPVLTFYTKDPCPLCDQALAELKPLLHKVVLEKVDITAPENKTWWKAYCYDIPVFHLNGQFLMKHRADLHALETALEEFYRKTQ